MIRNIVFDLGGVLIDWNPRYLFRKIFKDEKKIDWFLSNICTMDWNEKQDEGRSLEEATNLLTDLHPEYNAEISAYYNRWEEMLGGVIISNLKCLHAISNNNRFNVYALTNWSAETFPIALQRYGFLRMFKGILVSGKEGLKKPDPKIYQLLLERYSLTASECLFIDDSLRNIKAAQQMDIQCIHLSENINLMDELNKILNLESGS